MGTRARPRILTRDHATGAGLGPVLRGELPLSLATSAGWQDLFGAAEHHRVLPLVARTLLATPDVPSTVAERLRDHERCAAVTEAVREAELIGLLDALGESSAGALLFKGAALAYTCYERPELRPRTDTDLLVSEERRPTADAILRRLGYATVGQFSGDLVAYQAAYVKRRNDVTVHIVDLHWRIANPQPFGDVLTYGEAAAEAVTVQALGRHARALAPVHALIVACVHRVAHHGGDPRLIWLVDIARIAARLAERDWDRFVELAVVRRVSTVCRDGLADAVGICAAQVPSSVLAALDERRDGREPTAAFLSSRRHAVVVAQDFAALPTWTSRARLLTQHAFPPAAYMRDTYAPGSRLPLPLLYVTRAWKGARKWLSRA